MRQLALLQGENIIKRFTLDKDAYTIGRSKDTDLTFDHAKVSRTHARLFRENDEYVIQDLNSTNYVFVNGLRIKQKQLAVNDRVQISSEVDLIYLEHTPAPADQHHTLMDVQKHFVHKDDLARLKKVTQSIVLHNRLDTILQQILKEGLALTKAERGMIVLTDGTENILWKYASTHGIDKDKAEAGEEVSHSILTEALKTHKVVVRVNESKAAKQEAAVSESMMSLKIFSAMCAPLMLNNHTEQKVIGLFYIDARQLMNHFTEVDQFLFDYLADHAAIAIFNAKRYADQQAEIQRLQLLNADIEKRCSALDSQYQKLLAQIAQDTHGSVSSPGPETAQTYSAGGVVVNTSGEILLVSQHGSSWSLPKGHMEVGEDPETTARREIHEESGISELKLIQSLGSYQRTALNAQGKEDASEIKTISVYLFDTPQMQLQPRDKENPEARWLSPVEAVKTLTHTKDQLFLKGVLPTVIAYIEQKKEKNAV